MFPRGRCREVSRTRVSWAPPFTKMLNDLAVSFVAFRNCVHGPVVGAGQCLSGLRLVDMFWDCVRTRGLWCAQEREQMRRRHVGEFGLSTPKIQRSVRFASIGQNFRRYSCDHSDRFNTVRSQSTTLVDTSGLVRETETSLASLLSLAE